MIRILLMFVLIMLSISVKADERYGVVEKVNGTEVIVRNYNITRPFTIGELYHIVSGDTIVVFKVTFPMQTIVKCQVVEGNVSKIKKGMRVYPGKEPEKRKEEVTDTAENRPVHLPDYTVSILSAKTIFTTWDDRLKLNTPGNGIVYFTAITHGEVNIGFSDEMRSTNQMYVFCVGGWGHTRSIISKGAQGALEAGNGKTCASASKSIRNWEDRYWVKLDKSAQTISIGYGDKAGENIILEWKDPDYLLNIRYFAFSCWADEATYKNVRIEPLR